MNIYTKNIYESIFKEACTNFIDLRIISGYASPVFLSRIINDFPNLNIELFIGMTSFQGLPANDHLGFQHCMQLTKNLKVYYQIQGKPNHMKIYEFSNKHENKIYIGSANFSENGFFHHKEILVEVDSSCDQLFEEQLRVSLLCNDTSIDNLITFYEESLDDISFGDAETPISNTYGSIIKDGNTKATYFKKKSWEKLRGKVDSSFYHSFDMTIVLPQESNVHWDKTGINAWVENKKPVIEQTPKQLFNKVFPDDDKFHIYTDDNRVLIAKLAGRFNGELHILNINLFDYIRERIGLVEIRPISYKDLELKGCAKLYFKRINKYEYYMSFKEVEGFLY